MGGEGYSPAEKDAAVRREAWDIAAEAAALWAVVHRRWWLEWRPWLEWRRWLEWRWLERSSGCEACRRRRTAEGGRGDC